MVPLALDAAMFVQLVCQAAQRASVGAFALLSDTTDG